MDLVCWVGFHGEVWLKDEASSDSKQSSCISSASIAFIIIIIFSSSSSSFSSFIFLFFFLLYFLLYFLLLLLLPSSFFLLSSSFFSEPERITYLFQLESWFSASQLRNQINPLCFKPHFSSMGSVSIELNDITVLSTLKQSASLCCNEWGKLGLGTIEWNHVANFFSWVLLFPLNSNTYLDINSLYTPIDSKTLNYLGVKNFKYRCTDSSLLGISYT